MEYPDEQEEWLRCLRISEENFGREKAREIAKIVYLEHKLLPLLAVEDLITELAWN